MNDVVIKAEGLGKKYTIGHQAERGGYVALRDVIAQNARSFWNKTKDLVQGKPIIQGDQQEEIWALKDVSFEVKRGEAIGIIGRNGAGKSTLLKVLSRITEPTSGRVTIKGRVASLLEVGTGFHPELTGRENIYLNGAILGMSRQEIKRKFDEIVAFAEIEKFLDTPVKRYSSGMYVRLAFAVAAHLEPEILLVDEVLAVGDAGFQKKCLGKMGDVAKGGRTVLFVSHNMGAISQLCPTCLWLDGGSIKKQGLSRSIITFYLEGNSEAIEIGERIFDENSEKDFQLRVLRILNKHGVLTSNFSCDEPVIIDLIAQVRRKVPGLYGYLSISKKDGTDVMVSDSLDVVPNPLDDLSIGRYRIRVAIPERTLASGNYNVYLNFASSFSHKDFNVDSPGVVGSFNLDDFTSNRGNKRQGYLSTLLSWGTSRID